MTMLGKLQNIDDAAAAEIQFPTSNLETENTQKAKYFLFFTNLSVYNFMYAVFNITLSD